MHRFRPGSDVLRLPLGSFRARKVDAFPAVLRALLVFCAIAVTLMPWASWLRASTAVTLVMLAAASSRLFGRERPPPSGWLVVTKADVRRIERGREFVLVDFAQPFGLIIFASADRATLRIALTTHAETRYVAARIRDAEDAAFAPTLIGRAITIADADLHGEDALALSASDAERLIVEVGLRVPEALDRFFLTDSAGQPVVLEQGELRIGVRRVDLRAPLEWGALIFQEAGGRSASVFEATWVRQADMEIVLVAPIGGESMGAREPAAAICAAGEGPLARRALARDLRLMRAQSADPPPRELRRAIDHPFMLPIRRALEQAPRPARISHPSPRPAAGTA